MMKKLPRKEAQNPAQTGGTMSEFEKRQKRKQKNT